MLNTEISMEKKSKHHDKSSLILDIVINDLKSVLLNYDSETKGLAFISINTGLSSKTLKRIIKRKNNPSPQTLVKLYQFFTGAKDLRSFNKLTPPLIVERLKNSQVSELFADEILNSGDFTVEEEFLKCSVTRKIYAFAETGTISKEFIGFKYGEDGLKTAVNMVKLGLLKEKNGYYEKGTSKPILYGEMAFEQSITMISNFFDKSKLPLRGENQVTVHLSNLNCNGFNEWLKIDLAAYHQKVKIANNPKFQGKIKSWTTSHTDTMIRERIYQDNTEEGVKQ